MELSSVITNNNINTNIISTQNRTFENKNVANTNNKLQNGNSQSVITTNVLEKHNTKEDEIISSIEKANKKLQGSATELSFSVHSGTKQIMIKILDTNTKEIVKEIPSEKILDMVANLMETAGLIIDKKM